ncbi:hypothetical protein BJX76DRAFT_344113 [Aspergillus varians]
MAKTRAVTILHPLDLTGSVLDRSLTFNSESDRVEIGRASKRENKNLAPDHHNALFDSRVMSRTHAIIRASLEKKIIYIRDPGSMHGTWLNKEKIPIDKDVALSNGDVLTFGVEVVRGSDTFPPLEVRFECQWLESLAGAIQRPSHHTASNTFCVPDDDDSDEVECVSSADQPVAVDLTNDETSESNASSVRSDSENSRSVIEVPSPMTSPLRNNDSKDVRPTDSSAIHAQEALENSARPDNDRDVNSEQPLATPRMTPSSVGYESEDAGGENQYYDEYFGHSSDEDSNVVPDDWEMEEEREEYEEQGQEEDEEEEEEAVEDNTLPDLVSGSLESDAQVPKVPCDRSSRLLEAAVSLNGASPENQDEPRPAKVIPEYVPGSCGTQVPDSNPDPVPDNKLSSAAPQQQERPSHGTSCTVPFSSLNSSHTRHDAQPSFQPSGNLSDHYHSSLLHDSVFLSPLMQKPQSTPRFSLDPMPVPSSFPLSQSLYNDGPFATSPPMPHIIPSRTNTASGSAKSDFMPFMDPLAPMMPRASCDAAPNSNTAQSPVLNGWKTSEVDSKLTSPKKRKAAEIESDLVENDHSVTFSLEDQKLPNEENDLPDAQRQSIAAILNGPDSQLTTVSIPESTKETKEEERPSKMVKTSQGGGNLRSHAATAILGAMVGAVGTIAALASLPPDYFA